MEFLFTAYVTPSGLCADDMFNFHMTDSKIVAHTLFIMPTLFHVYPNIKKKIPEQQNALSVYFCKPATPPYWLRYMKMPKTKSVLENW